MDSFEYKLSKPLNINVKSNNGNALKCESLTLKCTSYRHSHIELQLEQLFMDGQFGLANKASNLINNQDKPEEDKEPTDKEKFDLCKTAYFIGGVDMEKLLNLFKKLFCGKNPVCFVDEENPLDGDFFDQLATKDKKNLICKYTAVFFISDWL